MSIINGQQQFICSCLFSTFHPYYLRRGPQSNTLTASSSFDSFLGLAFRPRLGFLIFGTSSRLLLPDWEFFDRDFSQWFYPMTTEQGDANSSQRSKSTGFRIYPLRIILYTTVYGFGLYKWWMFVSN
uniref:Uncharacterized protein n=1 Tax=Nelumbo nucifera TaxID=4432 RepID=A0A822ZHG7_NELNU|nr:TPA_asm: hypothetical protein HUJ06_015451 [Nelumbo nucifera]